MKKLILKLKNQLKNKRESSHVKQKENNKHYKNTNKIQELKKFWLIEQKKSQKDISNNKGRIIRGFFPSLPISRRSLK